MEYVHDFRDLGYQMSEASLQQHVETLRVSFIQDVTWNDRAFEDLVIDTNTKDLVKAVVTNTLREEENLDLIEGKGNGLCILLHGYELFSGLVIRKTSC